MRLLGRRGKFSHYIFGVLSLECLLTMCSVLCSELAVKLIDEPFISATDDKEEWAL